MRFIFYNFRYVNNLKSPIWHRGQFNYRIYFIIDGRLATLFGQTHWEWKRDAIVSSTHTLAITTFSDRHTLTNTNNNCVKRSFFGPRPSFEFLSLSRMLLHISQQQPKLQQIADRNRIFCSSGWLFIISNRCININRSSIYIWISETNLWGLNLHCPDAFASAPISHNRRQQQLHNHHQHHHRHHQRAVFLATLGKRIQWTRKHEVSSHL